ncbi:MAG: hypothetical protein PWQ12_1323 [Clostridiales bacterium]|jgi:DNA-binding response OmpR family regulator|nr:hypothetical protein [Clostridiales bacterium]
MNLYQFPIDQTVLSGAFMDYKILVVEDQKEIRDVITGYLKKEGFLFKTAENGFKALDYFSSETFHLVVLDVMMPGIDGFEVLQEIRNLSDIPVILLTARAEESDRLKGFDIGADDYVVKPFSPRELIRRIHAIFKRTYKEAEGNLIKVGEFTLDLEGMRLAKNGEAISITSTEFQLLHAFMTHVDAVLTRDQLIQLAFGDTYEGYDRNIDSHIKRLRQKIETDPKNPTYLQTKYGAGYIFEGGEV